MPAVLPRLEYPKSNTLGKERNPPSPAVLVQAITSLYDLTADVDAVIDAYYDNEAKFEDPIVDVQGKEDIKGQFRALQGLFKKVVINTHTVAYSEDKIVLDWTMAYYIKMLPDFLGRLTIRTITSLQMKDGSARVLHHYDMWSLREMIGGIPFLSWVYNAWRPLNGKFSSTITNFIHDKSSYNPIKKKISATAGNKSSD